MIWILLWLLCGILTNILVLYIEYKTENKTTIELKDLGFAFIGVFIWPLFLFVVIAMVFDEYKDKTIFDLSKLFYKEVEEEKDE